MSVQYPNVLYVSSRQMMETEMSSGLSTGAETGFKHASSCNEN